jgi:hypothetical protein
MSNHAHEDRITSRNAEVVASFTTYRDARRALDFLAERNVPLDDVTIIARDLRVVEHVTGRRGYGAAARDGAASGSVTGALLGFILGIFTVIAPLASALALMIWGLLVGAILGGLSGIVLHTFARGRGDISTVRSMDAGVYDVVAPRSIADRARRTLADLPLRPAA